MIVDHIRNRALYYGLGEDFKKALDYFATVSDAEFEKCNIEIPGTDIVIKCRPMMTKSLSECSFEAHKSHADIHFVAYGRERIGYTDTSKCKEISYDPKSDASALEGTGDLVTLERGYFMITLPDDAHMPCVYVDGPEKLGKMIAKISLERK